ncbi:hypothetical protein ACFOZ7_07580 [Natribaculum luteum]|uniref:Uncharacterized protein n=1 Tax=Natribaculum luteum TaxID=1586232 RepID=A0ABD5NXN9_9EURY|nr:hypothetical protein [Natribaculum luteum]
MTDEEIASAAAQFHEDVPHQFQVSLTMSMETRERLRAVKEELDQAIGERVVTTNDVMSVALLAAARYHAVATGDVPELETIDEEYLLPLTSVVRQVLEDEDEALFESVATDRE